MYRALLLLAISTVLAACGGSNNKSMTQTPSIRQPASDTTSDNTDETTEDNQSKTDTDTPDNSETKEPSEDSKESPANKEDPDESVSVFEVDIALTGLTDGKLSLLFDNNEIIELDKDFSLSHEITEESVDLTRFVLSDDSTTKQLCKLESRFVETKQIDVAITCLPRPKAQTTDGIVSFYGDLIISSNALFSETKADPVQLAGISLGTVSTSSNTAYYDSDTVALQVSDMYSEIIRTSASPEGVSIGQDALSHSFDAIAQVVTAAIEQDTYVIVSWETDQESQNLRDGSALLTKVAKHFGDYDNVLFEIAYTDDGRDALTWATVKSHSSNTIDAVREYSDNIVVAQLPQNVSLLTELVASPINDNLAAYSLALDVTDLDVSSTLYNAVSAASTSIPLFITHLDVAELGDDAKDNLTAWAALFDENDVSYIYCCVSQSEANGIYETATTLNDKGELIQEYLTTFAHDAVWRDELPPLTDNLLIDDFSGDTFPTSLWGFDWYTYDDNSQGGESTISDTNDLIIDERVLVEYTIAQGDLPHPGYVGIGLDVADTNASAPFDHFDDCTGIEFDFKGDMIFFRALQVDVDNFNYHEYQVDAEQDWTKITVLWSDLDQSRDDENDVSQDKEQVNKLEWTVRGPDSVESGEFEIDNIRCAE